MSKTIPVLPAATTALGKDEPLTCGMCLHFKSSAHRGKDDLCSKLGVRAFQPAPRCFTPDITKVIKSTDNFVALLTLLGEYSLRDLRILQAYLRSGVPDGFALGEEVYLNLRQREYVANYVRGFIVGRTSSGEIIIAGDPSNKTKGKIFFAYLKASTSILRAKEWRVTYRQLVERGRIEDPKVVGVPGITHEVKEDNYEVPTIDNAPVPPSPASSKKKAKGSSGKKDLVEILTI
jgi:hypothetical protein